MINPALVKNGQTISEPFYSNIRKSTWYELNYRHIDGELFHCVDRSLEACYSRRDKWIAKKEIN